MSRLANSNMTDRIPVTSGERRREKMSAELTLERTEKCLQQAKAKAIELNVEAAIVVVDGSGRLAGALRMDNALWITPEIAQAKAATASAFRATNAEIEE